MPGTRVTLKDKQEIFELLEAKMSYKDIHELTGRSFGVISNIKREWKQDREVPEIEPVVEAVPEKTEPDIANSDYAKAVESGDARYVNNMLDVQRTLKIQSRKTNITYEMVNKDEIRINFSDGNNIIMTLRAFERFADESVDVYLECAKYAKTI